MKENKRVIDKIKTETAVMKRVLSTVESQSHEAFIHVHLCLLSLFRKEIKEISIVNHRLHEILFI